MPPIIRCLNENYFDMVSLCNKMRWRITFTQNTTSSTIKNVDKTTSSHHSINNMAKSRTKLVRKKYGVYLVVLQTKYFQSVCVLHSHTIK
jgi:hypothetical protein